MNYWEQFKRRREKKYQILYKRGPSTLALVFAGMAIALWAIFALLSSYPVGLYLYYSVLPKTSQLLAKGIRETSDQQTNIPTNQQTNIEPEPAVVITKDTSLAEGHYLTIPRIGVDTAILEGESAKYEEVLRKGVWRVGDFGDPELNALGTGERRPIILAAHRFGYLEWTQAYREKNSFYNLPKLEGGDQVAIIWNQHRYSYRVTRVEEGTQIGDYSSDLILYTCKFLVSPVRVFAYATLVK